MTPPVAMTAKHHGAARVDWTTETAELTAHGCKAGMLGVAPRFNARYGVLAARACPGRAPSNAATGNQVP